MILGPLLAAQVEISPGIATSLDAIKSMLDQLDLQMGASRALEHPCAPAMRAVGCDGFECFRAAVRESNVALPEECERALVADTRPSSSSLTVETEESEDTRWLFSSLFSAAGLLNDVFGGGVAVPLDSTTVRVRAPIDPAQKVSFVSLLENIEVEPERPRAKVVVNARTGTIVIGGDVRVSPAAVTHGSLTVRVEEDVNVTQTQTAAIADGVAAIADGAAIANPDTEITAIEEQARAFVFDPGVELSSIVDALNAVGGSPSDLVAILEALREAGSLRAELIVI